MPQPIPSNLYKQARAVQYSQYFQNLNLEMILSASTIKDQSPDNPNLDGDYIALLQQLKTCDRPISGKKRLLKTISKIAGNGSVEDKTDYSDLFDAVEKNNLNLLQNSDLVSAKLNGKSLLHHAVLLEKKDVTTYILNNHPKMILENFDIYVKGLQSQKNIVHILAENGDLDSIKYVLSVIETNKYNKQAYIHQTVLTEIAGQRPRLLSILHLAALHGHTELVIYLVEVVGMSVNLTNNKNDTPVLWAARWNHIETVKAMITLKANLQHQNDKGSTPLYWAIRYGFPDMVKVLIEEGKADINQTRKLGLVSPLILAASMGYSQILEILLENGANVDTTIHGHETALHYASALGHTTCAKILLNKGASVDFLNELGETPLQLAAMGDHCEIVNLLLENGARLDHSSKDGTSLWHIAIEKKDTTLLELFIQFYMQTRRLSKLIFPENTRSPLHIAAYYGSVSAIKEFKEYGVDLQGCDEHGNTILHVGARENHSEFLSEFLDHSLVDLQSKNGETALHVAVRYDLSESVKVLLKKSKLSIYNEQGESVVHVAAKSSSPEIVSSLIEVLVKTASWSHVNNGDKQGNTILHIAARFERSDLLKTLDVVNPKAQNRDGDTVVHVAVRYASANLLQILLGTFDAKSLPIDAQNIVGESPLHLAAKLAKNEHVEILLKAGCNLLLKDKRGNTVLHTLVQASISTNIDYMPTLNEIIKGSTRWWCVVNDLTLPDNDTDLYDEYRRASLINLTSCQLNNSDLSVVEFAAKLGAKNILASLLNLKDVYVFKDETTTMFDVSNLTPNTQINRSFNSKKNQIKEDTPNKPSCLDLICNIEDINVSSEILRMTPIAQLVVNYWAPYRWLFVILMVIHIGYMTTLSVFGIQFSEKNDVSSLAGLLLIWPVILLLFVFYYGLQKVYVNCTKKFRKSWKSDREDTRNIFTRLLDFVIDYMSQITCLIFSASLIAWYILYRVSSGDRNYPLAVAYVFGWMFSISFTQGFEAIFAFSIMFKYIIIRDIIRFLFLYIFVLLAFSLALHSLFLMAPGLLSTFTSQWDTIFTVFNMMIGMSSLFEGDELVKEYEKVNKTIWTVRITYLIYIILATIILLNLLIAMMNDSYVAVKAREGSTWRVGSIKLALQMEKSVPWLSNALKKIGVVRNRVRWNDDIERYMFTVSNSLLQDSSSLQVTTTNQAIKALDIQVSLLKKSIENLSKKIAEIEERRHIDKTLHAFRDAVRVKQGPRPVTATRAPRPTTAKRS
ncbi:DgyrCDS2818 [Dimorphilus gyrociliatus]|uniref:DgyrCDS2818 n=1 Tax=Dimorphilus gyrociliatus TaxID=2664684 RepID=A0A7I8VBK0_9ANNE|nr:DgyrCDS2818 [Dimorphilus gyrociliatus]